MKRSPRIRELQAFFPQKDLSKRAFLRKEEKHPENPKKGENPAGVTAGPDYMWIMNAEISWEDLKKNSDGMVPVIVQDHVSGEVLMLAYMNREAYESTLRTGRMTYWSRSRDELWIKGETSGHYQYVRELRIDCDNDTVLAKVEQIGAACHTGNRSCFYRIINNSR